MSNVGQAVLVIGGTIVGSFFGNPQLGFLLGNLAGQALFPTDLGTVSGPKLDDLSVTSSALGAPIPLVYGTYAIAGNIIWSTDLLPTTTSERVGGKGGPTQRVETTTYAVSFAVGLCEGPITGVRRIWAGGKLIYDRRPQLDDEDNLAYASRINAADAFDAGMAVYLGVEDQQPDPTIEAWEGVGNVPAYRGLAYVVFTDFQLADYGNNLAGTALRFEVTTEGGPLCEDNTLYSPAVWFPLLNSQADPYNPRSGSRIFRGARTGTNTTRPEYSTLAQALSHWQTRPTRSPVAPDFLPPPNFRTDYAYGAANPGQDISVPSDFNLTNESRWNRSYELLFGPYPVSGVTANLHVLSGSLTDRMTAAGIVAGDDQIHLVTAYGALSLATPQGDDWLYTPTSQCLIAWIDAPWDGDVAALYASGWSRAIPVNFATQHVRIYPVASVTVFSPLRAPDNPCRPLNAAWPPQYDENPDYCVIEGQITLGADWELIGVGGGSMLRASLAAPVGPIRGIGSDDDGGDQAFWEAAYNAEVAAGRLPAGWTFGVQYPVANFNIPVYRLRSALCVESGGPTTVGMVVRDLCGRAGLAPDQVTATDLTQPIEGYAIGRVCNAADGIQPLRPYAFFDAVESEGRLKFVTRGKATVGTLTADDLGAHASGEQVPPAVKVTRTMDVELPRTLWVRYAMLDKDYEPDAQGASRLRTTANQQAHLELPIAMSTAKAAQLAEINLYEAWAARNSYEIDLGNEFMQLEPTDTINVPIDGGLERVRIVAEEYRVPGVKRLQAVRDDSTVYFSYATGAAPLTPGQTITVLDDTRAEYLDLPALRDVDDDAGYYGALRQDGANSWPGASVLRSPDGGASFNSIGGATTQAVTGELDSALPAGPSTIVDEGNQLLVTLDRGALESVTATALDGGANAAAIGAHGRWEVIQFRTATSLGGGQWRLTGLLRGRRGTEHAIGQSQVGDRFVLLDAAIRLAQDVAAIGVSRPHRAVTFGRPLDSGVTVDFSGDGEALRPYAPVHLSGERNMDGDLAITWIRRGRIGRELVSGADIPLSEESEIYDVEVLDGPTVVRTLAVSAPTAIYTAAQQTTDFGSTQTEVTVRIYQRSATVGRGYPLEGTV